MKVIYQFNDNESAELLMLYQKVLKQIPEYLAENLMQMPSEAEQEELVQNMTDAINELITELQVGVDDFVKHEHEVDMNPVLEQQLKDLLNE